MSKDEIYRFALMNLSDTVVITDENGRFTFVCPNINIIFGYSPDEVFSMTGIKELTGSLKLDENVLNDLGEVSNIEIAIRDKDGHEHMLLANVKRVSVNSGTRLYSFRDITAWKHAEVERRAAIEVKEKFLSMIAHDLKNPFIALAGFSELLLKSYDDFDNVKKKEFIGNIAVCSGHMYTLLENLLKWSEFHSNGVRHLPEKCNLYRICSETIELLNLSAERKNVTIFLRIGTNETVLADEKMLSLIFRNLISNSIKFCEKGGQIEIYSQNNDNYIEITVSDTGVGISDEDIDILFKTNIRYSTPGTSEEWGTGLGLILCKEFTEINGGKIWAQTGLDCGSCIKFTVPKWDKTYSKHI